MLSNTQPQLDRGDMGAIPDPDWSQKMGQLSHHAVDAYIASFGRSGPLSTDQAIALMQHLPPPPSGYDRDTSVLEQYVGPVSRWKSDVARGVAPSNPTPNELAAWCDHMGIDLPQSFVNEVSADSPKNKRPQQAAQLVPFPSWLPQLPSQSAAPLRKRGRGRPKSPINRDQQLVDAGNELQKTEARSGRRLTTPAVAAELCKRPEFAHMSQSTVTRKLNGKLAKQSVNELVGRSRTHSSKHQWKGVEDT